MTNTVQKCPQVYEHVYETVDINSSPEVRANATAKVDFCRVLCDKQARVSLIFTSD